jgi:NitT/TauT family transport system ATP-binding protein
MSGQPASAIAERPRPQGPPEGGKGSAPSAIEHRGVGKSFAMKDGPVIALQDIDLVIERGEFVSVVGPSGCGKSTLLLITAGLAAPSTGSVAVNGKTVRKPVTDVGIVFQRDVLFDWKTVLGNIMLQAEIRRLPREPALIKAGQLIARVGLAGFENARPWQLSGGMRQRVSICRALLHDASLLLLDEPFGALDALTRDQMILDLQRIWFEDRRTALFITHDIGEAIFLSDRVLVMSPRPGRIVADLRIDLPRPRDIELREDPRFIAYQREIRGIFRSLEVIR